MTFNDGGIGAGGCFNFRGMHSILVTSIVLVTCWIPLTMGGTHFDESHGGGGQCLCLSCGLSVVYSVCVGPRKKKYIKK